MIDKLIKTSFFALSLLLLAACQSGPQIPDRVVYDCDLDVSALFPEAPSREITKLSEMFVWINGRMKGGLGLEPGRILKESIEKSHFAYASEKGDREYVIYWMLPLETTKNNNPMNVIVHRQGSLYTLTRIPDEYRRQMRFSAPRAGFFHGISSTKVGYCPKRTSSDEEQ